MALPLQPFPSNDPALVPLREQTPKPTRSGLLGQTAIYRGTAHPWLTGLRIEILGIFKVRPGQPDPELFQDEVELATLGGHAPTDTALVAPWIEKEGRFSWVTSDAKVGELELESLGWVR
jgi:hypothetical protein